MLSLFRSSFLLATVAMRAVATDESSWSWKLPEELKGKDHGKALMEWLKETDGGFFHPNLELRRQGSADSPFFGMFATEKINQDDVILRIPRDILLSPQPEYHVGDIIVKEIGGVPYKGVVHKINPDGTYQIVYDDADVEDNAKAEDLDFFSANCKAVEFLVDQMKMGNKSKLAPYINYINSQPTGQLPSAWSDTGKALLLEILGSLQGETEILPPFNPTGHVEFYDRLCDRKDPFEEHAYLILLQRGWDHLMIPVLDMINHGNGHWLNTKITGSVHDPLPVTVQASRDIQKGEEIFNTYNFCEDCGGRRLWYGTPEILRDYGFVENYPQRWVFENQDVIFDLDYKHYSDDDPHTPADDKKLKLTWVQDYTLKSEEHASFFLEQLQRLEDLNETVFQSKELYEDLPDHEWRSLEEYRMALISAMRMALDASGYTDGSCVVEKSTRYDCSRLDQEKPDSWGDHRPFTCDESRSFGVAFWDSFDVEQSPYQRLTYLSNPTFGDSPDTCLMLDEVWQICTSYRPHYHEIAVHYTAAFLKEVKRVLFVGGGDSMLLHEVIKYPTLEKVIGLEIDQQVTRSVFKHMGVQPHFDNEKVEWWFGDAAKSMLLLPKEHYGSFDLVLVDLSETVASLSVTDELDVMEALSLLVKTEGILVKNEYEYFPKQRETFRDTLHVHFDQNPIVCSQSFILSSNGVDFLRQSFNEDYHGVDHMFFHLDNPNARYELSRDYQKNNTNPLDYCIASEHYKKQKDPTVQEQSAGVTMIVEAEEATGTLESSQAVKRIVEDALEKTGFSVLATVTGSTTELPVTVTILREGYVVARAWPQQKYCAYDIHLWSSFEKHEAAKKALLTAVSSSSPSSYRIVSGGMFGVSTWKEDAKGIGPKLGECKPSDGSRTESSGGAPDESVILTVVEESMSLVREENNFVIAVICGQESKPCKTVDAMKKASGVTDVIALHGCASLTDGGEFLENAASRMLGCEKSTWKLLQSNEADKKKIRAIVVDSSAESPFVSVLLTFFKSKLNKSLFFAKNMTVVAPLTYEEKPWRKDFVDTFRREINPVEPTFKSEVFFNSTVDDTYFVVSIADFGDNLFFDKLVQFAEEVEKKTKLVAEINNVRGPLSENFVYRDPKTFQMNQVFVDADYDQASMLRQWDSQKPLGLQTLFQLEVDKKEQEEALSSNAIKTALEKVLAAVVDLAQGKNVAVEEFTEVGDGCILVAVWSKGNVVALWDGKVHVDINLFLYEEDFDFDDQFEKIFTAALPGLKRTLRDQQPRGIGRVVSFRRDLEKAGATPRWLAGYSSS